MYRVLPQRWTIVPVFAAFGAVFGFGWSARDGGVPALASSGDLRIFGAVAILGSVGLILGLLAVMVSIPADSRQLALQDRFPDAIVVQGWKSTGTANALIELDEWRVEPHDIASTFAAVFDRENVSVYFGSKEPVLFARIPWSSVSSFELGHFQQGGRFSGQLALQNLKISVARDTMNVDLEFAVARIQGFVGFKGTTLDEAELVEVIAAVNDLRSGATSRPQQSSYVSRPLEVRPTAWGLTRFTATPVMFVVSLILIIPVMAVIFTGNIHVLPPVAAVAIIGQLGFYAVLFLAYRANKREAAAGYTTLNRAHLNREQRHPRTGRVLRAAGAPPLTKEQFREALALSA